MTFTKTNNTTIGTSIPVDGLATTTATASAVEAEAQNPSEWIKAIISLPAGSAEDASFILMELGAAGVEIKDKGTLLKTPEDREELTAYFPATAISAIQQTASQTSGSEPLDTNAVKGRLLEELLPIINLVSAPAGQSSRANQIGAMDVQIHFEELADPDWAEKWKEYYSVMKISDRITICPIWEEYEPAKSGSSSASSASSATASEELVVRLDPGQAFGTGKHATTTLCLKAIDQLYRTRGTYERVLDVGSGSGILAIACALLGSRDIIAVDNDPLSIDAIKQNAAFNSTSSNGHPIDYIDAYLLETDTGTPGIQPPCDLVLANIQSDSIRNFGPRGPSNHQAVR